LKHVWFVRHGAAQASSPQGDAARTLTPQGRADLARGAAIAARFGVRADALWTSPFVRAQETASIVGPAFGSPPQTVLQDLVPEGPTGRVVDAIRQASAGVLVVVSHLPLLPSVVGAITGARVEMGTGTLVHVALLSDTAAALLGIFPLDRMLLATETR
jgi:phosphohistidine phosphatase